MKRAESKYLQKVRLILKDYQNIVNAVDEIASIEAPELDKISVNTKLVIEYAQNLEYERYYGVLDGAYDDYEAQERKIATQNLRKIEDILEDIEIENEYTEVYWVELVYSYLSDGKYLYKLIHKKIDDFSRKDADRLIRKIRLSSPKEHPDDRNFILEDVRINVEIVDSKGVAVQSQQFLTN